MSKVTLVVDFPDGKTPAVNGGMDILGGRLCSVVWDDVTAFRWIMDGREPPPEILLLVTTFEGFVEFDSYSSVDGWRSNPNEVKAWAYLPEPYDGGRDE